MEMGGIMDLSPQLSEGDRTIMRKPLYQKILDELREKIRSGHFLPGQALPTELELAEQYKVSRITSKRAMEELEREGLILRKRGVGSIVTPPAERMDQAVGLMIAMVFPFKSAEGWVLEYVRGASDYLETRRSFLSIRCSGERMVHEVLGQVVREQVDGIIYYPDSTIENEELLATMLYSGMPIVTIDKYFDGMDISSVTSDNRNGMRQVVQHLVDLGHRKIGFFSIEPVSRVTSVRDRYMAYCQTLVENRIPLLEEHVSCFTYHEFRNSIDFDHLDLVEEKMNRLLKTGVTAIVAENDLTALFLYVSARNTGRSIPEDFSLTGFDDLSLLRQFSVSMTTVRQDPYSLGAKAAEMIYDRATGRVHDCVRHVHPVDLIVRSTTARPRLPAGTQA